MRVDSVTQNTKKILEKSLKKVQKKNVTVLKQVYDSHIFHIFDALTEPIYVAIDGKLPEAKYFHDFFSATTLLGTLPLIRWNITGSDLMDLHSDLSGFSKELQNTIFSVIQKEEEKQLFLRHLKSKNFELLKLEVTNWAKIRGSTESIGSNEGQLSNQILSYFFQQAIKSGTFVAEGATLLTEEYRKDGMLTTSRLLCAIAVHIWKIEFISFIEKFYSGKVTLKEMNSLAARYIVAMINEAVPFAGIDPIRDNRFTKATLTQAITLAKRFSLRPIITEKINEIAQGHSVAEAYEDFKDLLKDFSESTHRTAAMKYIATVMEEVYREG